MPTTSTDEVTAVISYPRAKGPAGRLGEWSLHELLGEGGAATVYAATNDKGMTAAVKVLHAALAAEPKMRERFSREAYTANSIEHPGVVRVLGDGVSEEGRPYLVMELLVGETVEARRTRKGGTLPVHEVLWIADQTLSVLAAAHAKGIVHRDVKPENLFLTNARQLKVLDLGIARVAESTMTSAGALLGTLTFMPPEQARSSKDVDVQSDLWAVGATMFTLLSGRLVREEAKISELVLAAAAGNVVSLASVAPGLSPELVDLVDFALNTEKSVRWPSAKSMRRAIRFLHAKLKGSAPRQKDDGDEIDAPPLDAAANQSLRAPPPSIAPPPLSASSSPIVRLAHAETLAQSMRPSASVTSLTHSRRTPQMILLLVVAVAAGALVFWLLRR